MLENTNEFDTIPRILRLDIAGRPIGWINWQRAVCLYARDLVIWTMGDFVMRIRGGISAAKGTETVLDVNSIIACAGRIHSKRESTVPPLTNRALFARDRNLCLYCGEKFSDGMLTRDHVTPNSRGGTDSWNNVVAACKRCNVYKGNRMPHERGMELLALPYEPNHAEFLALTNSGRILGDQLTFLENRLSEKAMVRKELDLE